MTYVFIVHEVWSSELALAREQLKGELSPKLSVANMIELLLKSFLVYHSPMFEAWKSLQTINYEKLLQYAQASYGILHS